MEGIITTGKLELEFLFKTKLKHDYHLLLGFIPMGPKWTGEKIAERLVEIGIVKVHQVSKKTGKIMSVYASKHISSKDVEIACLGFSGVERLEGME